MIKIRAPYFAKGKLILQYRGTNIIYKNDTDSSQIMNCNFIGERQMEPLHNFEKLFVEFNIIPESEKMAMTLQEGIVYRKVMVNDHEHLFPIENNKITELEILMDSENIYFIGIFSYVKANGLAEVWLEEYHFTAIFARSERMIEYIKECLPEIKKHIKSRELFN